MNTALAPTFGYRAKPIKAPEAYFVLLVAPAFTRLASRDLRRLAVLR
jgi:hypothetical protein